jgi:hypothetical protein
MRHPWRRSSSGLDGRETRSWGFNRGIIKGRRRSGPDPQVTATLKDVAKLPPATAMFGPPGVPYEPEKPERDSRPHYTIGV